MVASMVFQKALMISETKQNRKNQHAGLSKKCSPDGWKALGEKKDVFKLNYYCLCFCK